MVQVFGTNTKGYISFTRKNKRKEELQNEQNKKKKLRRRVRLVFVYFVLFFCPILVKYFRKKNVFGEYSLNRH